MIFFVSFLTNSLLIYFTKQMTVKPKILRFTHLFLTLSTQLFSVLQFLRGPDILADHTYLLYNYNLGIPLTSGMSLSKSGDTMLIELLHNRF